MINEYLNAITDAGWSGVMIYRISDDEHAPAWMGCLVAGPHRFEADHDTNLWDYQPSAEDVLRGLAEKAGRIGPPAQGR